MKMIQTMSMLAMAAIALGSCSTPDVPNPEEIIVDSQPEQPNPDLEQSKGKTLVIYYSYTGNTREIVADLHKQTSCDVVEIIPEDTGPLKTHFSRKPIEETVTYL